MTDDLFHDIPGNPRPENAQGGYFTARDGRRIRYACFAATGRPLKGTVVILSGRNECIEKYFETVRDLAARGLGSAVLDWRGQGGSDRLVRNPQRGYVKSFFDYAADLEQFFGEVVLPDCRGPYYILAHSTGALIALLAAPSMVNRVRRMVLIAPFLALPGQKVSMRWVRRITTLLTFLGFGRIYAAWGPRPKQAIPFAANKLTTDLARYRRNTLLYETYPELALGGPTVRWLRAASIAAETVSDQDYMGRFQVPTLIVGAGADEVVSTRAVEHFARHLRLGSFLMIDGARHEILQEADLYREQFLAAFDAFVPGTEDGALQASTQDAQG
ncbi:MAG: alpha/beta hydrolase [Mesorhizobium sp.]|nr:alpha/beta hydrolase [Mesorhizobium sp.]MBN9242943.1 alpha/beta hydrolase [Mesorhizobium sp.]